MYLQIGQWRRALGGRAVGAWRIYTQGRRVKHARMARALDMYASRLSREGGMLWLQAAMSRQRARIDQAVDHQVTSNLGFRVSGLGLRV